MHNIAGFTNKMQTSNHSKRMSQGGTIGSHNIHYNMVCIIRHLFCTGENVVGLHRRAYTRPAANEPVSSREGTSE